MSSDASILTYHCLTGFSYNYISPSNFGLGGAYVANNTLAPSHQEFKALIIMHNDTMTLSGVKQLKLWAHQGFPVVFSGGIPSSVSGHTEAQNLPAIVAILNNLTSLPNVYIVPTEDLADHLVSVVGLSPRASVQSNRPWLTYWREDKDDSVTYVVLYNDATGAKPAEAQSTGSVTFDTSGAPFIHDAGTGQKTPVLAFEETCHGITIPMTLAGNQTVIVAFHKNESSKAYVNFNSAKFYTSSVAENSNDTEVNMCAAGATEPLTFTNGSNIDITSTAASVTLQNWTPVVEAWTAPVDPSEFERNYTSPRINSTFQLQNLMPWAEASDSLRNVSGRGFYNSTFDWSPADGTSEGAILSLGCIVHTARVWINRQQVPPLDPTEPIADITDFLVVGRNSIEIVVATTFGGSVRAVWEEIQTGAVPVALAALVTNEQEYGLAHPVEIIPCRRIAVSLA